MPNAAVLERFVRPLLAGKRAECRHIVQSELEKSSDPSTVYRNLLWPAMERVDKLFQEDRINAAAEAMATRINRAIADQIQLRLKQSSSNGKRILISCADGEPEELGAQMTADLFEARGWEVYFLGGAIPNDEILNLVGQLRPTILLIFGTSPAGVPGVRKLVDLIREVSSNPTMNIIVSGGVFNRADGLWTEVNADLYAATAHEAIVVAESAKPRPAVVPVSGVKKKRRRRRRSSILAVATENTSSAVAAAH